MKVVIAGYGLEGKASFEYWNIEGNEVAVADEQAVSLDVPSGVTTILGEDAFTKLGDADLIIRSPSIHPDKLPYPGKVWSTTNEFFAKCPAPIIGVTGTKGKGSTSSFITSILRAAGKTVHLVGNIGVPALLELPKIQSTDIVVFELSSFQLWDIQKSPHVAVVLGIEPDHLDVHHDMQEYIGAKANIARYQGEGDTLVYNSGNATSSEIAASSSAKKMAYPFDMTAYADALVIPGRHNIENASAAIAATSEYVADIATIRQGLTDFTGLPHRIKFIREVSGVKYYDDSYSSAPSASIAALKSFDVPRVILLGGFEKGADFNDLADCIAVDSSIQAVVYGANRERLAQALQARDVSADKLQVLDTGDFKEIVVTASKRAEPGSVVLLSPGCASFDMFKNFTDRGEQFIKIVEEL